MCIDKNTVFPIPSPIRLIPCRQHGTMMSWLYNIGSTVLMGTISMVVFFFVFKIIFPEGDGKKKDGQKK